MAKYIYRAVDSDDGLRHYGVKGMKWHRHKAKPEDDNSSSTSSGTPAQKIQNYRMQRALSRARKTPLHQSRMNRGTANIRTYVKLRSKGLKKGSDGVWRRSK